MYLEHTICKNVTCICDIFINMMLTLKGQMVFFEF